MLFNDLAYNLKHRIPSQIPNIGQVKAALKHLNPKKATGENTVPASVLRQFHKELVPAVLDIICTTIQQSKSLSPYKYAFSPVPKMSNPLAINNNFRHPVMILLQIAKVLEKFQVSLNKVDLKIINSQRAFTEDISTATALGCATRPASMLQTGETRLKVCILCL